MRYLYAGGLARVKAKGRGAGQGGLNPGNGALTWGWVQS